MGLTFLTRMFEKTCRQNGKLLCLKCIALKHTSNRLATLTIELSVSDHMFFYLGESVKVNSNFMLTMFSETACFITIDRMNHKDRRNVVSPAITCACCPDDAPNASPSSRDPSWSRVDAASA